ncbi:MAG: hypothetical protein EXS03_03825 [Phycisphaerales bacterium]|nr:hypothetical protein [Phycisphaerales bacterium]
MFNSPGQRSPIAVDFSRSATRMIQLSSVSTAPAVHAVATLPAATGIFEDGPLDEPMARRLRDALKQGKFSGAACALALPSSSVFTELVEVPSVAGDELRDTISWTAVDRMGMEREDLVAGHLPIRNGTLGGTTQEVLVVASQKSLINRAIKLLAHAGLQTNRAELGAVAAMRMAWGTIKDGGRVGSFGFLHLEPDRATLALLNLHGLAYFRAFEWESSAQLNPDLISIAGTEAHSESKAWRWRQLGEQVLQCLRHVERRAPGSWPECIRMSGPLAEEPGVASAIGSVCGASTELFDSARRVDWSAAPAGTGSHSHWTAAIATILPSHHAPVSSARRVA